MLQRFQFLIVNHRNNFKQNIEANTQEHRLDTVRLLVGAGADLDKKSKVIISSPLMILLRLPLHTQYGDDALQTASVKGALAIFNFLLDVHDFSLERICDAFDLMGASFLLETQDISSSLFFWRK